MNKIRFSMLITGVLALLVLLTPAVALAAPGTFVSTLTGSQEVPLVTSIATGDATFVLSPDGNTLTFTINVANINDAIAAHIHLAPVGVSGPVVVPLFSGLFTGTGVLAQGSITSANLQGALLGMPLSALVQQIESGNTYVNVHTLQNPGGEIRGQIIMLP